MKIRNAMGLLVVLVSAVCVTLPAPASAATVLGSVDAAGIVGGCAGKCRATVYCSNVVTDWCYGFDHSRCNSYCYGMETWDEGDDHCQNDGNNNHSCADYVYSTGGCGRIINVGVCQWPQGDLNCHCVGNPDPGAQAQPSHRVSSSNADCP